MAGKTGRGFYSSHTEKIQLLYYHMCCEVLKSLMRRALATLLGHGASDQTERDLKALGQTLGMIYIYSFEV